MSLKPFFGMFSDGAVEKPRTIAPTMKVAGFDLPNPAAHAPDTSGDAELPKVPSGDQLQSERYVRQAAEQDAFDPERVVQNLDSPADLFDPMKRLYQGYRHAREAGVGQDIPSSGVKADFAPEDLGQPAYNSVGTDDPGVTKWLEGRGVVDLPTYEAHVGKRTAAGTLSDQRPLRLSNLAEKTSDAALGTLKTVAAVPVGVVKTAFDAGKRTGEYVQDIGGAGFTAATNKLLDTDKAPIGNVWAGRGASTKSLGGSILHGVMNIPAEVATIAEGVGGMASRAVDPEASIMQRAEGMSEGARGMAADTVRSLAKTALDPQASLDDGLLNSILNAGMLGSAVRDVTMPAVRNVLESRAAKASAELTGAKLDKSSADALAQSFVDGAQAPPPEVLSGQSAASARFAKAAKKSAAAEAWASRLQDTQALQAERAAIRAQREPIHAKEQKLQKEYEARYNELNKTEPIDSRFEPFTPVLEDQQLASIARKIQDLRSDKMALTVANRLVELDEQIAKNQYAQAWKRAISRLPEYVGSSGVTAGFDAAQALLRRYINRPDATTYFRRWFSMARDKRLPQEFQDLEYDVKRGARATDIALQDAVQSIPEEHRPIVRDVLTMESRPLYGYHPDGPDAMEASNLIEWDSKHPTPYGQGGWRVTPAGENYIKEHTTTGASGEPRMLPEAEYVKNAVAVANQYARPIGLKTIEVLQGAKDVGINLSPDPFKAFYAESPTSRVAQVAGKTAARPVLPGTFDGKVTGPPVSLEAVRDAGIRGVKTPPATPAQILGIPISDQELFYGRSTELSRDVLTGLASLAHDVAQHKLLREIAKDKTLFLTRAEMEARVGLANWQRIRGVKAGAGPRPLSSVNEIEAFKLVPNDELFPGGPKKWGALAGGYLQGDVLVEFANAMEAAKQLKGTLPKVVNAWKMGKTGYSVKTHSRNVKNSALVIAPLAGMSLLDPTVWPHYAGATQDLVSKATTPAYRMAVEDGIIDAGFKAELGAQALSGKPGGLVASVASPLASVIDGIYTQPKEWLKRRGKTAPTFPEGRLPPPGPGHDVFMPLGMADTAETAADAAEARAAATAKAYQKAPSVQARKSLWEGAAGLAKLPVELYGAEDTWFRLALYRRELAKAMELEGVTDITKVSQAARKAAAKLARDTYVDYSNIPGFAQVLRAPFSPVDETGATRLGSKVPFYVLSQPFISYPVQAVPQFAALLAKNPIRAKLYLALGDYLNDLDRAGNTATDDQASAVLEAVGKGQMRAVPTKGEDTLTGLAGKPSTQHSRDVVARDLTFLNPAGGFIPKAPVNDKGTVGSILDYLASVGVGSGPSILQMGADIVKNRDTFSGKPVRVGEDTMQNFGQVADYVGQQLLPPTTPPFTGVGIPFSGGNQWRLIAESGDGGKPGWDGNVRTSAQAWNELLGGVAEARVDPYEAALRSTSMLNGRVDEEARAVMDQQGVRSSPANMQRKEFRAFATEWAARARPMVQEYVGLIDRFPRDGRVRLLSKLLKEALKVDEPRMFYQRVNKVLGRYGGLASELSKQRRAEADDLIRGQ